MIHLRRAPLTWLYLAAFAHAFEEPAHRYRLRYVGTECSAACAHHNQGTAHP